MIKLPKILRTKKPTINLSTMVILLIVAVVIFFIMLSNLLLPVTNPTTRSHEIGEIVTIDNSYSVAVTKATFDNSLAATFHLPDTMKVLVVDVQITNLSKEKLNYLPYSQTFLRNDRGESFEHTPGVTLNSMPPKLIDPTETLNGEITFIVPSEYMSFWFYVDTKFQGQGPIAFNIVK